ncbi:MAG: galactose mutarotase [Trueperaceae bacterium]|nr:galactose mutarotase [Trueperaceae bacterium]
MADIDIATRPFGTTHDGRAVTRLDLTAPDGSGAALCDLGAAVLEVRVPGRDGRLANVVLGHRDVAGYLDNAPYFGVVVGRCANRIGGATFELDGHTYRLTPNEGPNQLHGGPGGFHARVWEIAATEAGPERATVSLRLVSEDGDQGYPGRVDVSVTIGWTARRELELAFEARCDAPTVVNLAHHGYWNLAGEGSGTVDGHQLRVRADAFLPVGEGMLPTGELRPVDGTPYDLRRERRLAEVLRADDAQVAGAKGVDHCFVLDRAGAAGDEIVEAVRLHDPVSGRTLRLSTTEPGVQVYAGGYLDGSLVGRSGRRYRQGDGIALEPQRFPDAVHHPHFPSVVLRPDEVYRQRSVFALGVD